MRYRIVPPPSTAAALGQWIRGLGLDLSSKELDTRTLNASSRFARRFVRLQGEEYWG